MGKSKGLLIIAHGSPRKEANDEFINLVAQVRSRLSDHIVEYAFLDCTMPTIPEGIDLLANKAVTEITVLPFFLVAGKHTVHDINEIVDQKRKEYPKINIILKSPIGSSPKMIDLMMKYILD